jgi:hypothetical protein
MSYFDKGKFSTAHASVEVVATTVEASQQIDVLGFDYIINDGEAAVQFNIDAPVGETGTFTLKAGERRDDWPRKCRRIYWKAATVAPVAIRISGLRE